MTDIQRMQAALGSAERLESLAKTARTLGCYLFGVGTKTRVADDVFECRLREELAEELPDAEAAIALLKIAAK